MRSLLFAIALLAGACSSFALALALEDGREKKKLPEEFAWLEPPPTSRVVWSTLPGEIAEVLRVKAAGYESRALGFSCRETIRTTAYSDGHANKERRREYDYLLVEDPLSPSGLSALRTMPGSSVTTGLKVNIPFPEPYLFYRIFADAMRSTLRFQVGQWHTTPWRLAIPLSWTSSAPVFQHERINEWSGTMDIEYRSGNIIRIVAHPNYQDERLKKELEHYLTAFRIMGFSTATPPIGLELTIDFDFEHEGFLYPSRVELRTFRLLHRDLRVTESKTIVIYKDYKFFGAHAEENIPPFLYRPPANPLPARPQEELFDDPFKDL